MRFHRITIIVAFACAHARADTTPPTASPACSEFVSSRALGDGVDKIKPGDWLASLDDVLDGERITAGNAVVLYNKDGDSISLVALRAVKDGFCVIGTYGWSHGGRGSHMRFLGQRKKSNGAIMLRFRRCGDSRGWYKDDGTHVPPDTWYGRLDFELANDRLRIVSDRDEIPIPRNGCD
jgi:hypothetical protein